MNARTVLYWLVTALFVLGAAAGGVMDLMMHPEIEKSLTKLGYPLYVGKLLGVFKLLGVLALLAPRMPLLKEWAYAGFVFELIGAIVSHAAIADYAECVPPVIVLTLCLGSYFMRPGGRRLDESPTLGAPGTAPVLEA